jgi:hypothetical protein
MHADARRPASRAFPALALLAAAFLAPAARAADAGFSLQDKPGECLDVLLDGKTVARYVYAHDTATPARRLETYKTYVHVFDAEGKAPITKGAGGDFTHHRGIFIGWNKLGFNGKTYDRWHMNNGEQVHRKFLDRKAGPEEAVVACLLHWNDETGKPIVEETRTLTFRRAPAPARLVVDFATRLAAPDGDVKLDGDPEHAGIHYRPANEVSRKDTIYVFPKEGANAHKDQDYPWVGETYVLDGKKYSVVQMNPPENPKGTKFSAYRDYGRFGAFFTASIKQGESLAVKYRFLVADGEMPGTEVIQKSWDAFAGATAPTPVPKAFVVPAEQPKPAAPKAPAAK